MKLGSLALKIVTILASLAPAAFSHLELDRNTRDDTLDDKVQARCKDYDHTCLFRRTDDAHIQRQLWGRPHSHRPHLILRVDPHWLPASAQDNQRPIPIRLPRQPGDTPLLQYLSMNFRQGRPEPRSHSNQPPPSDRANSRKGAFSHSRIPRRKAWSAVDRNGKSVSGRSRSGSKSLRDSGRKASAKRDSNGTRKISGSGSTKKSTNKSATNGSETSKKKSNGSSVKENSVLSPGKSREPSKELQTG